MFLVARMHMWQGCEVGKAPGDAQQHVFLCAWYADLLLLLPPPLLLLQAQPAVVELQAVAWLLVKAVLEGERGRARAGEVAAQAADWAASSLSVSGPPACGHPCFTCCAFAI